MFGQIVVFILAQIAGIGFMSIPFAIYGMVKRKQADKHKDGAFPYMKYYSIEEARKYAPYVLVAFSMEWAILEGFIRVLSSRDSDTTLKIILEMVT